ncbi:MAG: sulfatase-like hydrolase/transferase [Acidimicrobiia bacterium]|nr:sulfatase-like hydrolase/transferase [Acidimicrobiia bacterium]
MPDHKESDGNSKEEAVSRRTFLKGLGAAGLVTPAALSGCSDSGSDREADRDGSTTTDTSRPRNRRPGSDHRPNFLVIVADDMRYDQLWSMKNVIEHIQKPGISFTQARCNVPLCQPSRVGMFSGQLSKHHHVIDVGFIQPYVHVDRFIQKALANAGYTCGLTGKFVNRIDANGGTAPPDGFTLWREIVIDHQKNRFTIRDEDGLVRPKGIYPTDYYAREAIKFLGEVQEPFALWMTPSEPHSPFTPRANLAHKFSDYEFKIVD